MKTNDVNLSLDLQAYADGQFDQLALGRREELERLMATDASAKGLVEQIRALSAGIRRGEPAHSVPATREFYWSQIQRRMAVSPTAAGRPAPVNPLAQWMRWLVPAFGAAAIAVTLTLTKSGLPVGTSGTFADGGLTEAGTETSEAMVFRSESDGITIHWLN
jgi:anti-sigma factor RsiW